MSFSAAETKWPHLLNILGLLIDKKQYIDEEFHKMTWDDISRLIKSDLVTCARHFDYMVQLFLRKPSEAVHSPLEYH